MKGSPEQPKCGFSARAAQCLTDCGAQFSYIDILEYPNIRQTLPIYSDWPTFPQLYINGEFIGGCDIVKEMFNNGELQLLLKEKI